MSLWQKVLEKTTERNARGLEHRARLHVVGERRGVERARVDGHGVVGVGDRRRVARRARRLRVGAVEVLDRELLADTSEKHGERDCDQRTH